MSLPPSYLDASKTRPLTKDETGAFLSIMMNGDDTIVPVADIESAFNAIYDPAVSGSFNVQVMIKRLAAMRPDLSFSPKVVLLCAMLSDRVGVVVQWAYTLVDYERRHGKPMSFDDWVLCFPMGIPTSDEQRRIWDAQKRSADGNFSDNQLDGREPWAAAHVTLT